MKRLLERLIVHGDAVALREDIGESVFLTGGHVSLHHGVVVRTPCFGMTPPRTVSQRARDDQRNHQPEQMYPTDKELIVCDSINPVTAGWNHGWLTFESTLRAGLVHALASPPGCVTTFVQRRYLTLMSDVALLRFRLEANGLSMASQPPWPQPVGDNQVHTTGNTTSVERSLVSRA